MTVQDTQAPAITCPANITVPNTAGACNAVATYTTPTPTDNCPGATAACVPASGTSFPVGVTTVTCTAMDASPNSPNTTCTFTVTVQDTQAPAITCPANITVPNTAGACNAVVTYTTPTPTDNCPGATAACLPASGTTFNVGVTTVTCTAMDASPNSPDTTCTFTVTVQDTQAPTLSACPANITAPNATGACNAVVTYTPPTATDNCGTATVTCVPASGSTFVVGTTTVTCTATDASVNSPDSTCMFTVTVQDTQAPTITCPANQTAFSASGNPISVTFPAPTAADNCPGVTVVCVPASGANFAVGVTTVTCTASDASPNSPDTTCSFTVTVNSFTPAPTMSLVDPLNCNGPGDVINGSVGVANPTAFAQTGTVTVALPAGIIGLPDTCVSNIATCTATATTVSWSGTIPANSALTITYQAQFANNVAAGTVLCATTTALFNGITGTVQACLTVNCPVVGPGVLPGPTDIVSDQRAGSVLFYNLVSSAAANAISQNTRVSLTNINPSRSAFVHLFFVDGASCSIADSYLCLTPNQTASFLANDIDPGTTGYLVAVATDRNGCPVNFNSLIGDEYVKLSSGHAANLAAEAIPALVGSASACNLQSSQTTLNFDGVMYGMLPRTLALSNFGSRLDGNNTLLVVNRIGGNLATGATALGTLFGQLYDDAEKAYSFSLPGSSCQLRGSLSDSFPRTVPRLDQAISSGRSGWLRLALGTDGAILGAAINANSNAASNASAFNQGHNLHKLTLTGAASYTIPVFPPTC